MYENYKIIAFTENDSNTRRYGLANFENKHIIEIDNPFNLNMISEKKISFDTINILPPVLPSKILCVGLNYLDHAKELGLKIPEEPLLFMKPSSAIIGTNDKIKYPKQSNKVDYEAELVIVIKKTAKNIPEKDALNYILGYTCGNDVTARDLQKKDNQWIRAKSFDTFAPIGPYITLAKDVDPNNLNIFAKKNGDIVQSSNTSQMIFNCTKLVSFISHIMTLYPGDVIMTGTPSGIGLLEDKDTIEIEIENLGILKNIVSK